MWERMSKLHIQNVLAVIIIASCTALAFLAICRPIPQTSEILINKYFDMCLVGVIGWAFTQSKQKNQVP